MQRASDEFDGHCLALTLLGSYLTDAYKGDVRCRKEVSGHLGDDVRQGVHARKVMRSYESWFGEGPELAVLRMLGLFDRPADEKAFEALLKPRAGGPARFTVYALSFSRLWMPTRLRLREHSRTRSTRRSNRNRLHYANAQKRPMRNTDGKRRAHRERTDFVCRLAKLIKLFEPLSSREGWIVPATQRSPAAIMLVSDQSCGDSSPEVDRTRTFDRTASISDVAPPISITRPFICEPCFLPANELISSRR